MSRRRKGRPGRKPYPFSPQARRELRRFARRSPQACYREIAEHLRQLELTAELVDKATIRRACIRAGVR